jgi:hypothetical protein
MDVDVVAEDGGAVYVCCKKVSDSQGDEIADTKAGGDSNNQKAEITDLSFRKKVVCH